MAAIVPDDRTAHHSSVWPVTANRKLRTAKPVAAPVITQTAIQSIRRLSAVERVTIPMRILSAERRRFLPET